MSSPLAGLGVLELPGGTPLAYCGKLLADAGADVVAVELSDAAGEDMTGLAHAASDAPRTSDSPRSAGPLLHEHLEVLERRYLRQRKRAVVLGAATGGAARGTDALRELVRRADIVVGERSAAASLVDEVKPLVLAERRARVVLAVSAFGSTGPWAGRPATEFTLQALCGSAGFRGLPDGPPLAVGGAVGDYLAGAWAAAGALAAWRRAQRDRCCEVVDLSQLETMTLTMQAYEWLHTALMGLDTVNRSIEVPSIEAAKDGYVGITIMTPAQWTAFCEMIGRPELATDPELSHTLGRWGRRADVYEAIGPWLAERTVEEVVQLAASYRVPATRLGTGATLPRFDHFEARHVYVPGADVRRQPRPPWRLAGGHDRVAEATAQERDSSPSSPPPSAELPLAGLRVVDLTSFIAGPLLTAFLASMGADVVKVESVTRPDGLRLVVGPRLREPHGWEYSWAFHGANVNKRAITLDLRQPAGRDLLLRLVDRANVLVENFSPRVLPQLDLDWDVLHRRNPGLVVVRMPAFGLDGPWADRNGFAQTMEMLSGMAWVTGTPEGPPVLPRGPCDSAAAIHGAVALLAVLDQRDGGDDNRQGRGHRAGRGHGQGRGHRQGQGQLVEVPMIEVALNLTALQVLAHDELGVVIERRGNRGAGAPQNLYACDGEDRWVALAVVTDEQWSALREVLGAPGWARDPALDHGPGRRLQNDLLDRRLADWFGRQDRDEIAERLVRAGIPAAPVVAPPEVVDNPHLQARRFFEPLTHPVTGPNLYAGLPLRFARGPKRWNRTPPPLFGEHNREVLHGELGLTDQAWDASHASQVVGEHPRLS